MKLEAIGILCVLLCVACNTTPIARERLDETNSDPKVAAGEVIDVAVVAPEGASIAGVGLGSKIRHTARRHLLDTKNYAVPTDEYVDGLTSGDTGGDLSPLVGPLKTDGVLRIAVTQWDTYDLLGKGRIYAGGVATIFGASGALWERQFGNWTLLAPATVTASNRDEMSELLAAQLTKELLSELPPKPIR